MPKTRYQKPWSHCTENLLTVTEKTFLFKKFIDSLTETDIQCYFIYSIYSLIAIRTPSNFTLVLKTYFDKYFYGAEILCFTKTTSLIFSIVDSIRKIEPSKRKHLCNEKKITKTGFM